MKLLILCALFGAVFSLAEKKMEKPIENLNNLEVAINTKSDNEEIEAGNELIDSIIEEIAIQMMESGLDPMELSDIHKGFSYKPLIITYHGELDLTKGWLQDMSTLSRSGDVSLKKENGKVILGVPVTFKDLLFDYHYSVKIMNLGPSGEMDGKVENVKLFINVEIDFTKKYVILKKFDIEKIGKIKIKWHGNALVDWLANILTSITTTLFNSLITYIAENVIRDNVVEKVIDYININWQ